MKYTNQKPAARPSKQNSYGDLPVLIACIAIIFVMFIFPYL